MVTASELGRLEGGIIKQINFNIEDRMEILIDTDEGLEATLVLSGGMDFFHASVEESTKQ